jgi:6-phosphogluconolactonase
MVYSASLVVASTKSELPYHLNSAIMKVCQEALVQRGTFTIALSGGSLPSFLSSVKDVFEAAGNDPKFESWHIILADERCVPKSHPDSNMGALENDFLNQVSVPSDQVHAINTRKLEESTDAVASDYQEQIEDVLSISGGQLDLAVLGFGPDGHTCSLFPNHVLLTEQNKMVAAIEDSPKPPPHRITLTLPVLNKHTRHVIFCGAGRSKSAVVRDVLSDISPADASYSVQHGKLYKVTLSSPAPYPCAMVRPDSEQTENSLMWIVDADAMESATEQK